MVKQRYIKLIEIQHTRHRISTNFYPKKSLSDLPLSIYLFSGIGGGSTYAGFLPKFHPFLGGSCFILHYWSVCLLQAISSQSVIRPNYELFSAYDWADNTMRYLYSYLFFLRENLYIWWSIWGVTPSVVMPYVVIELVTECHTWSCSIRCFYVLTQFVSLIDLT